MLTSDHLSTYDLVYAGSSSPLYVALQPNGNVVLRPASTGPNFVGGFATTIFTVNCFGLFAISQGGQVWNWATNGATTEMTQGGSSTTRFVALPANLPAVQNAKRDRVRNVELSKKLKKRGPDQDGDAPRCPNRAGFPQNLVSHTKQGYQEDQGNMCDNMSDYWSLSPFDFDDSCAVQSLCYDQCEGWGWDTCNGIFGGLMFAGCADEFDSWWDVVVSHAACIIRGYLTTKRDADSYRIDSCSLRSASFVLDRRRGNFPRPRRLLPSSVGNVRLLLPCAYFRMCIP